MENKGLVHIYFGDGKGKTTAAIGLCIRCIGANGKVLFYQFLKDGTSSEINILKNLDGIKVIDGYKKIKFDKFMTEEEKNAAKDYYIEDFKKITELVLKENFDLLVLDEVIHAINKGYIDIQTVIDFIKNKPYGLEVILTGKNPDRKLIDLADYVSDILKIKHPFDKGIGSRIMIEK